MEKQLFYPEIHFSHVLTKSFWFIHELYILARLLLRKESSTLPLDPIFQYNVLAQSTPMLTSSSAKKLAIKVSAETFEIAKQGIHLFLSFCSQQE